MNARPMDEASTEGRPDPGASGVDEAPVVTIITPTYNHEPYIHQCLTSALAQTDPRWEQIVVDDGSTDNTAAIVESFDDPRIRLVRREHLGIMHLADTYNIALGMARGRFVAVLEGDDMWPADKIERQLPMFDQPDVVLSWGLAYATAEDGVVLRISPARSRLKRFGDRSPGDYVRGLLEENVIPAGTVMVRREALLAIGGFQQPAGIPTTDYSTWLALCQVGRFALAMEPLGYHRHHGESVTANMQDELNTAIDWGGQYIASLDPDQRARLGISEAELDQILARRQARLDYEAGRVALGDHHGRTARTYFRRALRTGTTSIRMKALIGAGASIAGIDLESVADLAHKVLGR
jgi:glycosyltransferase involved in cell wall biosynthesis